MKDTTDEFSFLLKPSKHGIGVFAAHDIKKGTYLRVFGDKRKLANRSMERKRKAVPKVFQQYCIILGDTVIGPKDFSHMSVGWHLNHSTKPNAVRDTHYRWYGLRNIKSGEENYHRLQLARGAGRSEGRLLSHIDFPAPQEFFRDAYSILNLYPLAHESFISQMEC